MAETIRPSGIFVRLSLRLWHCVQTVVCIIKLIHNLVGHHTGFSAQTALQNSGGNILGGDVKLERWFKIKFHFSFDKCGRMYEIVMAKLAKSFRGYFLACPV